MDEARSVPSPIVARLGGHVADTKPALGRGRLQLARETLSEKTSSRGAPRVQALDQGCRQTSACVVGQNQVSSRVGWRQRIALSAGWGQRDFAGI